MDYTIRDGMGLVRTRYLQCTYTWDASLSKRYIAHILLSATHNVMQALPQASIATVKDLPGTGERLRYRHRLSCKNTRRCVRAAEQTVTWCSVRQQG